MIMASLIKRTFNWIAYISEVQSIIIIVRHGDMQADMVLERELRLLCLDPQATGS